MTQFKKICATVVFAFSTLSAMAGGILTNTNQSISFLRNPAREAAIGLDGVYSNPAGVAFMNDGFHFAFNWQSAWQTRTIETTNHLFALGAQNNGATTKTFEGKAKAPIIPSLQAAYNKGKWSFQFNFSVNGGGGKCEFANGLGSFESAVAGIGYQLNSAASQLQQAGIAAPGVSGYDADYFMRGNQFYYGFTLGAAYKVLDNLSVYGGLRVLWGTASYKASIQNIKVISGSDTYTLPGYLEAVSNSITTTTQGVIGQYMKAGYTQEQAMQTTTVQQLVATGQKLSAQAEQLAPYYDGVNLQSDQRGWGIAPILGVDYKIGDFNFAAKYEFRTKMSMKNSSTLKEAMALEAVNQFQDGTSVREDSPALFTVGAQYSVLPNFRLNAGYHHFYDKQSKKYGDKQELLKNGTNEFLGGIEYDPIEKLTVSAGFQTTNYGLSDEYMSDLTFVVNSWSFGFGAKYQINDKVAVQAAYFQTNYEHYKTATADANGSMNDFTRTNKVIGVGVEVAL